MTKAEIIARASNVKLKIRTGDKVKIIAGKDKGEIGFVAAVFPKKMRAVVLKENEENADQPIPLNAAVKHQKARTTAEKSSRFLMAKAIHLSNLMVLDPKTNEPTRVGRRKEGDKIVRFAKKSGTTFEDKPNIVKD
ncbi:MAG: 50S ribosomal protein L24 [Fimbriimonadaceae bacterium]|nr:50S ribosomal protein L24 [Fimbriimonadaceae bacterium]